MGDIYAPGTALSSGSAEMTYQQFDAVTSPRAPPVGSDAPGRQLATERPDRPQGDPPDQRRLSGVVEVASQLALCDRP